jgi:hypothetical protein
MLIVCGFILRFQRGTYLQYWALSVFALVPVRIFAAVNTTERIVSVRTRYKHARIQNKGYGILYMVPRAYDSGLIGALRSHTAP